jgi:hypothetical protein
MKFFVPALLFVFIFSCKQQKQEKVEKDSTPPVVAAPVKNNAVETYNTFVAKLDTSKVASVLIAAKQFDSLFANADSIRADSAFVVFNGFYDKVLNYLNEQHLTDGVNYTAYVEGKNAVKGRKSASSDAHIKTLRENGFTIDMSEGSTYVRQDRRQISRYLYPHVSSAMKAYLVQSDIELEEGFVEDAGLVITPIALSKRILFWEDFLRNNPFFSFTQQIKQNQKGYYTFLLEGIDNTPLFDQGTQHLNSAYKAAFEFILTTSPQSDLAGHIKPYYAALTKNDLKTAKSLLLNYKKQGIMYDYSA